MLMTTTTTTMTTTTCLSVNQRSDWWMSRFFPFPISLFFLVLTMLLWYNNAFASIFESRTSVHQYMLGHQAVLEHSGLPILYGGGVFWAVGCWGGIWAWVMWWWMIWWSVEVVILGTKTLLGGGGHSFRSLSSLYVGVVSDLFFFYIGCPQKSVLRHFTALSRLPTMDIFLQQKLWTKYYLWANFGDIWLMSKLSQLDI